ncbi:hypothetical protein N7486_004725 [Penicillium sp. IBT 16267x]|nr:hypothetical protein N7486_004725 [Penicillium sp. IBT 16267x]
MRAPPYFGLGGLLHRFQAMGQRGPRDIQNELEILPPSTRKSPINFRDRLTVQLEPDGLLEWIRQLDAPVLSPPRGLHRPGP